MSSSEGDMEPRKLRVQVGSDYCVILEIMQDGTLVPIITFADPKKAYQFFHEGKQAVLALFPELEEFNFEEDG